MVTSMSNGYKIQYTNNQWVYSDTKENIDKIRHCKYCGELPTKEGYDNCIGYLPGVRSGCCGHGLEKPYVVFDNGEYKEFNSIEELRNFFGEV